MKNILILGASGSLAKQVIPTLLANPEYRLTLFVRNAQSVSQFAGERVAIVTGDVLNIAQLNAVMKGQDVVYAGLSGNLKDMAHNIVQAMNENQVKRLIFISSMGIYGETGENHGAILEPYRQSAQVIEQSDLDFTLLRPAWFTNGSEIDYALTYKGEAFKGHSVSRKSIADFILKLVQNEQLGIRQSIGIAKV
ncbi:NAD-dependent epimerase/dehydratase [Actinobacillus porcinus]|uniref:NAD-dependent epimerase/dehydratase n=1 Tax=Actinobacillus porcinus TaxID=51048 RepID=A0ABY6TNP8_9PAST|nr:NAD(P)H-binding protein [Actinobacillus porcinus]VFY94051.1 NAD-dependent epimerase/dehydratase [Actinobacillus porcinus]VTU09670.1 NAD-dependent epimerase/dehydratase [Actinobacillus porcinus]